MSALEMTAEEIQAEKEASLKLEGFLERMEAQAQKLLEFRSGVKQDLDKIQQNFTTLESLELSLIPRVTLADSQKYSDFMDESSALLGRLSLVDARGQILEIKELMLAALKEQHKLSDSLKLRKLVDKARSYEFVTQEKERIEEQIKLINELRAALNTKIDAAAKNLKLLLGNNTDELSQNIRQASDAQSLKDLIQITKPENLDEIRKLMIQTIENAREQKRNIDELFTLVPVVQEDIDKLARDLDRILEHKANDFEKLASLKGITPLETIKNTKLAEFLSKKPGPSEPVKPSLPPQPLGPGKPGGPPPMRPALGAQKSIKEALSMYKNKIAAITATKLVQARKDFDLALNNIAPFYDTEKLAKIKQALSEAENIKNYEATGQKLIDAVEPYTMEGLRGLLEKDGALSANDEAKFSNNFKMLSEMLNKSLFIRLDKHRQDIINQRLNFLKTEFNNLEMIKKVSSIMGELDAAKTGEALKQSCQDLEKTKYFKTSFNCAKFGSELDEVLSSAAGIEVLKALSAAKIQLRERFEPYRDMAEAATMESEFTRAIAELNKSVLSASAQINLAAFAPKSAAEEPYSVASLISETMGRLQKEEISSGKTLVKYPDVMEAYVSEIFPNMSPAEITMLQNKVSRTSKHALATTLQLILSPSSYEAILNPFVVPKEDKLIANMKARALGSIANVGVPEFERAIKSAEEAFDEYTIKASIEKLASFFVPERAQELKELAQLSRIDLGLLGQLAKLKELTEQNPGYQALKSLADIEHNQIDEQNLDKLVLLADALPTGMRSLLFAPNEQDPKLAFNKLKERLKTTLESELASLSTNILVKNKETILPVVNAFTLVFLYPLTELNKLNFNDNQRTKDIFALFVREANYVEKFKQFNSATTLETSPSEDHVGNSEIIKLLQEVQRKLNEAASTVPEIEDLKKYINNFLE